MKRPPNGLELCCPAEAGGSPYLYGFMSGETTRSRSAARRVSISELLGSRDHLLTTVQLATAPK